MVLDEEYIVGEEVVIWMNGQWNKVVVVDICDDKILLTSPRSEVQSGIDGNIGMWIEKKSSYFRRGAVCSIQ